MVEAQELDTRDEGIEREVLAVRTLTAQLSRSASFEAKAVACNSGISPSHLVSTESISCIAHVMLGCSSASVMVVVGVHEKTWCLRCRSDP